MGTWLLPLVLLACPVMMIAMMRGMHGGHDNHHSGSTPEPPATGAGLDPRDKRLAALEREVAALRAGRDHAEGSRP